MGTIVIKGPPVEKTPLLVALEAIGNNSSLEQMEQARALLESGIPLFDLFSRIAPPDASVSQAEIDHVQKDWIGLGPTGGFWPSFIPEDVMRRGFIRAIDIGIEYFTKTGTRLPVAYWWVRDNAKFEFVSLVSPHQQTILMLTPSIPGARPRGAKVAKAATAKKAKKATKAVKATKKVAKEPKKSAKKQAKKPAKKQAKRKSKGRR